MPDKVDKIEKQKRIRMVMEWIVDDYPYQDIVLQVVHKWGIKERMAKRYIAEARNEWNKYADESLDRKRRQRIESLKKVRRSLLDKYKGTPEGINAIVRVDRELIKLEGLEPPKRVELTGKDGQPLQTQKVDEFDYENMSPELLQELLKFRKKKTYAETDDDT